MKRYVKDWVEALLPAAIILCALFLFCWPVKVAGESMERTLSDGDRIAYSRVLAAVKQYTYSDLVVVRTEINGRKQDIIKRLVGLGGDTIVFQEGEVYRNGILLEEPYIIGLTEWEQSYAVPEGYIFVLGDNREESTDSRTLGPLPEEEVVGKAIFKFWPLSKFQAF